MSHVYPTMTHFYASILGLTRMPGFPSVFSGYFLMVLIGNSLIGQTGYGKCTTFSISATVSSPNGTTATWTAPATGGPYLIRITAKGAKGGEGAISVGGGYSGGSGGSFNAGTNQSNAAGANAAGGEVVVECLGAIPNLSIDDVSQSEGNAGNTIYTFTVSLDQPAQAGGVTFDIATANNTATTADNDYTAKSLTSQTIPEGSSTYTFTVTVNGDSKFESDESFFVNITNVTGANVTDAQGVGTITNDDAACPSGNTVTTGTTFCNEGGITINDNGVATPYPSCISVSGLTGTIQKVTITLKKLTHTAPDDIDLLLYSPTGQKFVFMSDAGGTNAVTNLDLILDSSAASALPDNTTLVSGTFRPADFEVSADVFPAPAPAGPYISASSTNLGILFNNTNPNGTWFLYAVDDAATNTGSIGGWCLNFTMSCAPPNISAPTVTQPTCAVPTGTIVVNAAGTGTLEYSINNGTDWQTNATFSGLAAGNYTIKVRIQGSPSCETTYGSNPVVLTSPFTATPTITPGGPTTFCTGGSVTLSSSSTTGNQWYRNGTLIDGATNQNYSANTTGNYTVIVTTLNCSSPASAPTSVTVNPIPATPTITPGGPTTFCTGGSVTLSSSSTTGNQWYLGGNPIGGATNQTYSATASGSYTVIVTTLSCSSPASAPTSVMVNPIPATPTITAGSTTTFCTGGSVTLTSSSTTGNQWYRNNTLIDGATNQNYSANTTGNYTVVVTASGCSSVASAPTSVTVNPIPATPTITAGSTTTFCTGGSVTLTSSSTTGNQWYRNGTLIDGATNQTYSANTSGNYTLIVTTLGCSSLASAPTTVTVNPIPSTPTITAGSTTTFCTGGSVTLTSSSTTGNQWYRNGTLIDGETNQTYSATATGNYTVVVTALGCSSLASAPTSVTVNPIPATPTITAGSTTTFCTGGSVTLTSSSTTGNQWYRNGTLIDGATNQTYSATATGNYTVVVTASGCSSLASAPTSVTVNPIPATPTISAGSATTFCTGGSVVLTSSSASGNQWYRNGTLIDGATNQTYSATTSGDYTVIVTTLGCSSPTSAPTSVTVNPIPATPTITAGSTTTFCTGGSVTLTSSAASGNQWYLGGNPIGGATNQTYSATATGNYTVVVTASGCSSLA